LTAILLEKSCVFRPGLFWTGPRRYDPDMTIRVLFFASLARDVGAREKALALADNATVQDALDALARDFSALKALRARLATAVNMAYVDGRHVLRDGDELALIPPVSGG
jgi:molybdopterin synthase catalytic subunit